MIAGWGGWTSIKQVIRCTRDLDRQALTDQMIRQYNSGGARRQPRLCVVKGAGR